MMTMTAARQTQFLVLVLIAAAIASAIAWSRLVSARDRATVSRRDRIISISEMAAISSGTSAVEDAGSSGDLALNRRLRGAVVAARLSDQLASIDPGAPVRIIDSDYMQTPVYLRLNSVSLKQLVGFLYELSISDNTLRTTDIELSPPLTMPGNRTDPGDLWTADVSLSCLTYQQREPSNSR